MRARVSSDACQIRSAWAGRQARSHARRAERRWSPSRLVEEDVDDPWVEMWLLPWPTHRPDDRPPIKIGTWPLSLEADALADAQSSVDEHGDTPRWH
jgi:hypothetical protein